MRLPATRAGRLATTLGATVAAVLAISQIALASPTVGVTQVSHDPYTNTTSYHQTQVEPDTYSFGSTIVSAFQTGRFFDGGSSNIGFATSNDSGQTWANGFLPGTTVFATPPGPWDRISDPSVAYDPKDGVWMITGLAMIGTTGAGVIVARSTDGGQTWTSPVTVSTGASSFYDKDWITCDTWSQSPNYGNCYVEWDDAGNGNQLHMSYSTDAGQSWNVSSVPGACVIGGQPVAQPNGNVVVPIDDCFEGNVESFVSTNGGQSYQGPYEVAAIQGHFESADIRTSPLPSAQVDDTGRVYVVWQDCRFRPSCNANDIVLSYSDNGTTWSKVYRIPIVKTSSSVDLFIPGIAVDRSTGGAGAHLAIASYAFSQSDCSTSSCKMYVAFASSQNGGRTWQSKAKVLGPLSLDWLAPTNQGYMVGDYIGAAWSGGRAFTTVADATSGACVLGQPTSCSEFMVEPTGGLPTPGWATRRLNPDQQVLSHRTEIDTSVPKTAF